MEKEELQAILNEFKTSLLSEVDRKNAGTAASITKDLKATLESLKPQTPPPVDAPDTKPESGTKSGTESSDRLTLKALQSEVKALQAQLEQERIQKEQSDLRATLTSLVSQKKPLSTSALYDLLQARLGSKVKRDGDRWFVAEGDTAKPLESAVEEFLQTPEGKLFLPATGIAGAGSRESQSTQTQTTTTPSSATEALAEAFGGLLK